MRRSLLLPLFVCFPALALAQVPFGPEFQVNAYTHRDQSSPKVAVDQMGRFVVVWHRVNEDYLGEGVFGQRLDAAGRPLGGEFRVSAAPTGDQGAPSLGVAIDGSFVVTW